MRVDKTPIRIEIEIMRPAAVMDPRKTLFLEYFMASMVVMMKVLSPSSVAKIIKNADKNTPRFVILDAKECRLLLFYRSWNIQTELVLMFLGKSKNVAVEQVINNNKVSKQKRHLLRKTVYPRQDCQN